MEHLIYMLLEIYSSIQCRTISHTWHIDIS